MLGALLFIAVFATAPRWGRDLLSRLDFFRVRHVEVRGTRYLSPAVVAARLRADTLMSVWDDLGPLQRRVTGHPQIATAEVGRRLPATIVVKIEENLPIALHATARGMQPYDAAGRRLPIDPSRTPLDLPLVMTADPALFRALGRIAAEQPAIFGRISTARRDGRDAMVLELDSIRLRAQLGVSGSRLTDIFPVESDLARRGAHAAELDLRYRDQVIVRLP